MGSWKKTLFAFLLLAVWLPCTMHCDLERAASLATCCPESTPSEAPSDCGGCTVCQSVESGGILASTAGKMLIDQSINFIPTFEIFLTARPPEEPASSFALLTEPRDVLSLTAQVILHSSHPIRAPSAA